MKFSPANPGFYARRVEVTIRRQLLGKASAGITVTDAEVDAALEKSRKRFNLTWEQFVEEQKKKGETVEEAKAMLRTELAHEKWLRTEVNSKFTAATEAELRSIYEKDKSKYGASFEESKDAIIKKRDGRVKQQLERQILDELRKKANVKTFLPEQK